MYPEPKLVKHLNPPAHGLNVLSQTQTLQRRVATAPLGKIVSNARHFSQIVYAIPSERARALFPAALRAHRFEPVETNVAGQSCCWLTVTSYLDQKSPFAGFCEEAVEWAEYRLHVQCDGQSYQWLLNTSVGSLRAVSARHLWTLPWHLSAMEFRLNYHEEAQRYQTYRLQMQSEHLNALWELRDSGEPLLPNQEGPIPSFVFDPNQPDCFLRHDGSLGTRITRLRVVASTRAELIQGRCDLLTRQGWLRSTELAHPSFAHLSRSVAFEQEFPRMLALHDNLYTQNLRQAA